MNLPPRVLLVEDDPAVRRLMRGYLRDLGLDALEAASAEAAIELLGRERPGLLCVDLILPRTPGLAVCEHARRTPALAGLPVLALSDRDLPLDRAQAEEAGADAFLVKPFSRDDFARLVLGLLEASTAGRPGLLREVR